MDTLTLFNFSTSKILSNFVTVTVDKALADRLEYIGVLADSARDYNVGTSNYSKHTIQPWSIWLDYNLDPWDADIVKRVLRTKIEPSMSATESRILDYKKIIHICNEKIRQLSYELRNSSIS